MLPFVLHVRPNRKDGRWFTLRFATQGGQSQARHLYEAETVSTRPRYKRYQVYVPKVAQYVAEVEPFILPLELL